MCRDSVACGGDRYMTLHGMTRIDYAHELAWMGLRRKGK